MTRPTYSDPRMVENLTRAFERLITYGRTTSPNDYGWFDEIEARLNHDWADGEPHRATDGSTPAHPRADGSYGWPRPSDDVPTAALQSDLSATILVRRHALMSLLRIVDTGGFWSNDLGIAYVPGSSTPHSTVEGPIADANGDELEHGAPDVPAGELAPCACACTCCRSTSWLPTGGGWFECTGCGCKAQLAWRVPGDRPPTVPPRAPIDREFA